LPRTSGFQLLQPSFLISYHTKTLTITVVFQSAESQYGFIDLSIQSIDIY